MKKFTSKIIALFIAALMICSVLPMGVFAVDLGEEPTIEWDISKSKSATNLDENFESQVTLSLPSAEEELVTDVVFVLDKSTSADIENQALAMLAELKDQVKETNAKVKVGVVIFNKKANVTDFLDLETQYDDIKTAIEQNISSGTNTHAGLLAGKKMLDDDIAVAASRKYLIFVSDAITYLFDDGNGNPTSIASEQYYWETGKITSARYVNYTGAAMKYPYGTNIFGSSIEDYFDAVGNLIKNDGTKYWTPYDGDLANAVTLKSRFNERGSATLTEEEFTDLLGKNISDRVENHANNLDTALYLTWKTYSECIDAGYNCYALNATNNNYSKDYPWAQEFMDFLAGGQTVSFQKIQNDILYLIDAGSTVVDYIGSGIDNYGNEYDFEFVNDIDTITLTVGDETLDKHTIDENHYGFGPDDYSFNDSVEYRYRFELIYEPDEDRFTWYINEPVSNFAPVQLTYTVKLTNPQTTPGTYGVYDENGSNGHSGLYTNEFAYIQAHDTAGTVYAPDYFSMPTVSYTVESEEPEPEPPIIINPTVPATIVKVDADNPTAKLSGAVFAIYYKQGISERLIGKYETDEDGEINLKNLAPGAYYAVELEAPEGYILDDSKHAFTVKMGSSNIITIGNTAVEVPPVFNEDDHFAYIVGYPDETVRPENNITRAEVITIFFRLLSDETRDAMMCWDNDYVDVNEDDWFNCAVSTLTRMGIINGYEDDTFRPNEYITRAEFAAIAARFELNGVNLAESFDDAYGHWAEEEIKTAKANGWILGYEDGTFKPDQLITRAEAMTIVNRVLCRIPYSPEHLHDDMIVWSDNMDEDAWYYLAVQEATNSHYYVINYDDKETWTDIREPRDWTELEKVH